jgi:cytochrome c oxidase cbb3-type subunit 3
MSAPKKTPREAPELIQGPDGIVEYDNPVPLWMSVVYVATVVWGIGYLLCLPGVGINGLKWSQASSYHQEMERARVLYAAAPGPALPALLAKDVGQPGAIAGGHATFTNNCVACHGAEAKGLIGPNLTDATWLYGGKPSDIAHTVSEGTPKGMPTFKNTFSKEQIAQLAAFVYSLSHS